MTEANGWSSIAIGNQSIAENNSDAAIGTHCVASGGSSMALGYNTTASGIVSFAGGNHCQAIGTNAIALGDNSRASGETSAAIGGACVTEAQHSFAFGYDSRANKTSSFSFGKGSRANGVSSYAFGENVIAGNDINGNCYAFGKGSQATGSGSYAFGDGAVSGGLRSYAFGSFGQDATTFPLGTNTMATANNTFAAGQGAVASGDNAISIGFCTKADAQLAIAMGYGSKSYGNRSPMAIGEYCTSTGIASVAMGYWSLAEGDGSVALGLSSKAINDGCTSIGRFNLGLSNSIFEIGNGSGETSRSNAFTILDNGSIGVGTSQPIRNFHLASSGISSELIMEAQGGLADWRKWNLVVYGGAGNAQNFGLRILNDAGSAVSKDVMTLLSSGNVGIGTTTPGYTLTVNGTAWCLSGTWTGSDIRWKKNILPLSHVLNNIISLVPVNYELRSEEFPEMGFEQGNQIGLIAQDVEKIYPELVRTDNNGYKAVSYEKLSVVLLEGIKEQQQQIESQKYEIEDLRAQLEKIEQILSENNIK